MAYGKNTTPGRSSQYSDLGTPDLESLSTSYLRDNPPPTREDLLARLDPSFNPNVGTTGDGLDNDDRRRAVLNQPPSEFDAELQADWLRLRKGPKGRATTGFFNEANYWDERFGEEVGPYADAITNSPDAIDRIGMSEDAWSPIEDSFRVGDLDDRFVSELRRAGLMRIVTIDGERRIQFISPGSLQVGEDGGTNALGDKAQILSMNNLWVQDNKLQTYFDEGTARIQEDLDTSIRGLESTLLAIQNLRSGGLDSFSNIYDRGAGLLDDAADDSRTALERSMNQIGTALARFEEEAELNRNTAIDMRDEALAAHSDQSANILDGMSRGQNLQLQAQKNEISGMKNVPAAAKAGMIQRLEMMNAGQLQSTVAQVAISEATRGSQIRMQSDTNMVNSSIATMNALRDIQSSAISAGVGAVQQDAANQSALAVAGAKLGSDVGRDASNFVSNMVTEENLAQALLTSTKMDGRNAFEDRLMDNPGAFVDVYGVYGALIGSALEIDRDSLDHAIVDYNTKINEWRNQTEHPQNLRMTGLSNLLRKGSSSGGGGGTDYGGIVGGIISLFGKNKPGEPGVDKGGNPINTQG